MSSTSHLTVGEVGGIFGVPNWKIRRVVDSLEVDIPRAGQYRLIPPDLLGAIAVALKQQGWMEPIGSKHLETTVSKPAKGDA